jgi:hypothetical protein
MALQRVATPYSANLCDIQSERLSRSRTAAPLTAVRGYNSAWFHAELKARGIEPCIPSGRSCKFHKIATPHLTIIATRSRACLPRSGVGCLATRYDLCFRTSSVICIAASRHLGGWDDVVAAQRHRHGLDEMKPVVSHTNGDSKAATTKTR